MIIIAYYIISVDNKANNNLENIIVGRLSIDTKCLYNLYSVCMQLIIRK